ncbi:MAG: DUF721 domain-containing protein [Phycisphaeraceae bacterium]|nr:MAG: DUF721 domain-containing protein [Phycisphaeraceae bacterium]
MDPRAAAKRLDDLRRLRSRERPAQTLSSTFQSIAASLKRDAKRYDGIGGVWDSLCPDHLRDRTAIRSLTRGTLTVAAADSATRFELDRWLRASGERALIRAASTTIKRIKIVLDASITPPGSPPEAPRSP